MHVGPRGREIYQRMKALGALNQKLQAYTINHPTSAAEEFEKKTIKDLVEMGILSHEDDLYIQEHKIAYLGYNPEQNAVTFEDDLDTSLNRKRLTVYSDGHGSMEELHQ